VKTTQNILDLNERNIKEIREVFEEKGAKALEEAWKELLDGRIECEEVCRALTFFKSYWHDVARPAIISLACEAVGGNSDLTAQVGKALVLISGAFDIHDDIIDQSRVKGSRSTVVGEHGNDVALVVGDALLVEGFASLL
jgi:geranylgeranyl pyrophosphate synthase